ncbi:MAG: M20/M25/M40 family metallo-hydrolase [Salinibacterium sp.]|nr:M20/M25/M40 family metallo-hydrolase [Salinibacterium sp.]
MSHDAAIARFQALLRIPTISRLPEADVQWEHFDFFITQLQELFPLVHRRLNREIVAGHTLVFRWTGRSSTEPSILMGHYDVVAATDSGWKHPPFAAELSGKGDDQIIWGRGTIDDKGAVVAILEAVEFQLEAGLQPAQDIYLCFGHNEETSGDGAKAVAGLLEQRGVRPALVLDEGGAIVEGAFPGVSRPVAVVGVTEKGSTTLKLVVDQQGGHASTPPKLSATTRLARAIIRLNNSPFPASFNPVTTEMLRTLGVHATGYIGFLFRNIRFTRALLLPIFGRQGDESNAMIRTTQAVTMLEAGQAVNALAERATATVTVRVAVGSTVDDAVRHVTKSIADESVRVEVTQAGEPSPVSLVSGISWELVRTTIEKLYPGTIVTPYVQNGATDSRHFTGISRGVYRFTPFELTREQRESLHAKNERMHVATYLRGIEFYKAIVASL